MKALPKKEGKFTDPYARTHAHMRLNESPSQKEGKYGRIDTCIFKVGSLNESPSQKEGKLIFT